VDTLYAAFHKFNACFILQIIIRDQHIFMAMMCTLP